MRSRNRAALSLLGLAEELRSRRILDNRTILHEDDPVSDAARKSHFMGYDDKRHVCLRQQSDDVEDFIDHFGIERGCRFVEQNRQRVRRKRPRDRHALLLSTGKASRPAFCVGGHADLREQRLRLLHGLYLVLPQRNHRRERDVVDYLHVRIELEALKDHGDLAAQAKQRR